MAIKAGIAIVALGVLAGCDTGGTSPVGAPLQSGAQAGGATTEMCWDEITGPDVVKTVSEDVLVQAEIPATADTPAQPAIYRNETRQVVTQTSGARFEVPCPDVLSAEFIASLQRALNVRGYYNGPVNGEMDGATRGAVRQFQKPIGLDSAVLSMDTARALGLVVVAPAQ